MPNPTPENRASAAALLAELTGWLALSPNQFDEAAALIDLDTAAQLVPNLEAVAQAAIRLSQYLENRYDAGGYYRPDPEAHRAAVKASNRAVRGVRKALGYTTTTDLTY